jgi:hypothetical protein
VVSTYCSTRSAYPHPISCLRASDVLRMGGSGSKARAESPLADSKSVGENDSDTWPGLTLGYSLITQRSKRGECCANPEPCEPEDSEPVCGSRCDLLSI